ncbi:MAG TPA: ABC transporter substrate-binding protein, partial [Rubrivivax sp.]|nr:ABC transporter substrate-binding protein [Rubrivivax sp.]
MNARRLAAGLRVAAVMLLATALGACRDAPAPGAPAAAAEPAASTPLAKTYKIGVSAYYGMAFTVVAQQKGFFADEGINVKVLQYPAANDWYNAMVNDAVDFAVPWNSTHITLVQGGSRKVNLGGFVFARNTHFWIVKPGVTAQNIGSKRLGMSIDLLGYRWMLYDYAQKHGLKMADLHIVKDMSDNDVLANFVSGHLDGALLLGDNVQKAIDSGGIPIATNREAMSLLSLMISRDTRQTMPPADVEKIVRACVRGLAWMRDPANTEALYTLLKNFWGDERNWKGHTQLASLEAFQQEQKKFVVLSPQELIDMNSRQLPAIYAEGRAL